jgi:hypothetical protein
LENTQPYASNHKSRAGHNISSTDDNHLSTSSWEWLERKEQALVESIRQGESAAQREWLRM